MVPGEHNQVSILIWLSNENKMWSNTHPLSLCLKLIFVVAQPLYNHYSMPLPSCHPNIYHFHWLILLLHHWHSCCLPSIVTTLNLPLPRGTLTMLDKRVILYLIIHDVSCHLLRLKQGLRYLSTDICGAYQTLCMIRSYHFI